MIIFNKSKFNIFFDTKLYISIKNKFIILCTVQFSYKNKSTDLYLPAYNVGSYSSVTTVSSLPVGSSSCVEVSSDIFTIPYVVATSLGTLAIIMDYVLILLLLLHYRKSAEPTQSKTLSVGSIYIYK